MSVATAIDTSDIACQMAELGKRARAAVHELGQADSERKNKALHAAAAALRERTDNLLAANEKDMAAAKARNIAASLLDRLKLDARRIDAIAAGLEQIADLPDPVGEILADWDRPNGLNISRVRVPLGVIGIIYRSRPNVTADAGGLCLKSGNAAIYEADPRASTRRAPSSNACRLACGRWICTKARFSLLPLRTGSLSAKC